MDVFWSKGYEASSTQELCEKTGLGKGACTMPLAARMSCSSRCFNVTMMKAWRYPERFWAGPSRSRKDCTPCLNGRSAWIFRIQIIAGRMAVNISMERAGRDPMVERIFGQYIYDLEEDLISVMEEAIQSERFWLNALRVSWPAYS